jgi:hypothetical protein
LYFLAKEIQLTDVRLKHSVGLVVFTFLILATNFLFAIMPEKLFLHFTLIIFNFPVRGSEIQCE